MKVFLLLKIDDSELAVTDNAEEVVCEYSGLLIICETVSGKVTRNIGGKQKLERTEWRRMNTNLLLSLKLIV